MRKSIILVIALIVSAMTFAQKAERDYTTLKGLSFGVGLPIEMRDLPGMGMTLNIGYDCAYPVNDRLAVGFYLTRRRFLGRVQEVQQCGSLSRGLPSDGRFADGIW